MLCPETNTAVIGRLRIRSKSPDPRAEQRRVGQMLRLATLHPGGLPPSSLLVVRRMADPLPRRLCANRFSVQVDAAWERAVTSELGRLAASAARPALGAAPTDAAAVLFCDRAELLAALALDWMSGALPQRWWWRELFRGRDPVSALLMEWSGAPQYVPAAVEILVARGRAVTFLQRLPLQAAEEILNGVISAYHLPRVGLSQPGNPETSAQEPPVIGGKPRAAARPFVARPSASYSGEPWAAWVPEACTPALSPLQKLLFAQAMIVRRAPATARSARFQREMLQWRLRQEAAPGAPAVSGVNLARGEETELPADEGDAYALKTDVAQAPEKSASAGADKVRVTTADSSEEIPTEPAQSSELANQAKHADPVTAPANRSNERMIAPESSLVEPPLPLRETSDTPEPKAADFNLSAPQETGPAAEVIETEFGGILFLLNLALYLHIYGDFTRPEETGLELSPWDFISLIGSDLTAGDLEKDPLWAALVRLAGRGWSEPPGYSFVAPEVWRLPPEWLEPFPEDFDRRPAVMDHRLICRHPAGFTVLDVPIASDGSDAQTEVRAGERARQLKRWVGWMAVYVSARLARALGRNDAVALCCRQRARVALRTTHVDVTFSLNHHPIELRMAGLDRDPGWIAAAGRYVAFHFE